MALLLILLLLLLLLPPPPPQSRKSIRSVANDELFFKSENELGPYSRIEIRPERPVRERALERGKLGGLKVGLGMGGGSSPWGGLEKRGNCFQGMRASG